MQQYSTLTEYSPDFTDTINISQVISCLLLLEENIDKIRSVINKPDGLPHIMMIYHHFLSMNTALFLDFLEQEVGHLNKPNYLKIYDELSWFTFYVVIHLPLQPILLPSIEEITIKRENISKKYYNRKNIITRCKITPFNFPILFTEAEKQSKRHINYETEYYLYLTPNTYYSDIENDNIIVKNYDDINFDKIISIVVCLCVQKQEIYFNAMNVLMKK
jgi:hypothetical protein